jgi:Cu2+-exporting ATPase
MHDPAKDKPLKNPVAVGPSGCLLKTGTENQEQNTGTAGSDNANTNNPKENEAMATKTMNIEGMMCGHCEASVKKALLALDGVEDAVVSHETGTAKLTLSADIPNEILKTAVEEKDYTVVSID